MSNLFKESQSNWEQIALAFSYFLDFTKAQIHKAIVWMNQNPEKVVLLVFAVNKAYRGDISSLMDFASIILS